MADTCGKTGNRLTASDWVLGAPSHSMTCLRWPSSALCLEVGILFCLKDFDPASRLRTEVLEKRGEAERKDKVVGNDHIELQP